MLWLLLLSRRRLLHFSRLVSLRTVMVFLELATTVSIFHLRSLQPQQQPSSAASVTKPTIRRVDLSAAAAIRQSPGSLQLMAADSAAAALTTTVLAFLRWSYLVLV